MHSAPNDKTLPFFFLAASRIIALTVTLASQKGMTHAGINLLLSNYKNKLHRLKDGLSLDGGRRRWKIGRWGGGGGS